MKRKLLLSILLLAKAIGCFKLCKWITRREVRIITYHGMALQDECEFRGGLFMSPYVFNQRMQHLKSNRYAVLELGDAINKLECDTHPDYTTVITIDDGWYGTVSLMGPILRQFDFPATLYLCSYYMEKQTQVFNVAVDYLLWKSEIGLIELSEIDDSLSGRYNLQLKHDRQAATKVLWEFSNSLESAASRQNLLQKISKLLLNDPENFSQSRLFTYMSPDEASQLTDLGIDIQLHTHRHDFPSSDFTSAQKEIDDNRKALAAITPKELSHFCYPSGEYEQKQLAWLPSLEITTATTTQHGFNTAKTGKFELRRFLDWEHFTQLEFEAEMSGFYELINRAGLYKRL